MHPQILAEKKAPPNSGGVLQFYFLPDFQTLRQVGFKWTGKTISVVLLHCVSTRYFRFDNHKTSIWNDSDLSFV